MRKCRQKTVETSFLRADRGETAVELDIIQKKWGGFAFSSLSDPQSPTEAAQRTMVQAGLRLLTDTRIHQLILLQFRVQIYLPEVTEPVSFLSTNYGTSWTSISTGLTNNIINALAVSGTKLMAGTWGSGVWSRPLSEITSVQTISSELPTEFQLRQNYPNPFNPTTNIKFDVARLGGSPTSNVKIAVFDVMGREVQMLVNESMKPGTYEVSFDGSKLTSGVYFYKISVHLGGSSTGDFTETKRMLLLK